MRIYDYIVIGGGLAGLAIAAKISSETQNILLIDSEASVGGSNKPVNLKFQSQNIVTENGFRFLPGSDMAVSALKNLENELGLKLIKTVKENQPETYDAHGFKPFVGFGDQAPEFYDQISYFLNPQEIELTLPIYKIVELLKEKYQGETLNKNFVTAFNFTDHQLTHVTVNGAKEYHAKNFIFAGTARDLVQLMPDDVMGARTKAKIKKDATWVGLCLDLLHGGETVGKDNLFILEGTTQDSIGPCVGRFLPPTGDAAQIPMQVSQWMSFIDLETSEETENIAEVLKKMKRQIKRAFPHMVENIKTERLFMTSPLSVGEIKMNANGTLPKVDNLWIASGQVNKYPNLLGTLLQSQFVLSSLGFGEAPVETTVEADLNT